MTKAVRLNAVVSVLLALTLTACIHKQSGPVTPWERVHTYNASFAEANNTLEQGLEAAVTANLLPAAQAAPIIGWTGQVAQLHQQVTAVLQQGTATTANVATVKALIDQMKASAMTLPPSALGIKNPRSQQTFQQDVSSIASLADAILSSMQAVVAGATQ